MLLDDCYLKKIYYIYCLDNKLDKFKWCIYSQPPIPDHAAVKVIIKSMVRNFHIVVC